MEIKTLKIFSKEIESQKTFYTDVLGFNFENSSNGFSISTKENTLQFEKSETDFYYHFAFLIPTGSIPQAIDFLEQKNIKLLPHQGNKIIQFDSGRAIYFYDKDYNIVEFIERPLLNYPHIRTFSIKEIIKLNEIGLPHTDPKGFSNLLISQYGITPLNKYSFSDTFCWVGDHNGVIIITKEGRNWLPTKKPSMVNDFIVHYKNEKNEEYKVSFQNNKVISLNW